MRKVLLSSFITGFLVLMVGCAETAVYGRIDQNNKTITAPMNNSKLLMSIKNQLQQNGWKVVIMDGPLVYEETGNKVEKYKASKTKYRLLYAAREVSRFFGIQYYSYSISIVDIETGQEVFAMIGESKPIDWILNRFNQALSGA